MKKWIALLALPLAFSSCVSSRIHKDLQAKYQDLQSEHNSLRKKNESCQANLEEAQDRLKKINKEVSDLRESKAEAAATFADLEKKYQALNKSYEFLLENNNALLASNQKENQKLLRKLNTLQSELSGKEDSLRSEQKRLESLSAQLQEREARVNELEGLIARKDSTVMAVRQRLKDALLNFDGKGLTVETRDGKVYVSLENSLLFPSASWTVEPAGRKALQELAKVLAENPELNVVVEGHTDSDAFSGRSAVKDNWDLSVMRATSIVKILVDNPGVNKQNITAAGRSEYVPIASNETAEGKAKNRRTEIIITPDLSELTVLLEETR